MNRRLAKTLWARYAAERAVERLASRLGRREFVRGMKCNPQSPRGEWREFCEAVRALTRAAARETRVRASEYGTRYDARPRSRCLCGGLGRIADAPCPRCCPAAAHA